MRVGCVLLAASVQAYLAIEIPPVDKNLLASYKVPTPSGDELEQLKDTKDAVFVKFYAPWCTHCKSLAPAWKELSATFSVLENVQVAEVDCDVHQEVCQQHDVKGYPTLTLFQGRAAEQEYQGPRTLAKLTDFLTAHIESPLHAEAALKAPKSVLMPVLLVLSTFVMGLLAGLYFLCMRPTGKVNPPKFYCQPDNSTSKPGHGPVYRVGPFLKPECDTMLEALQKTVQRNPKRNFLGHREIDSNGKAGKFVWESYEQGYARIQNIAAGLMHEKMLERTSTGHRMLCIYMKNRPEWVLAQYAAFYCGGAMSCLYDSLGPSSTSYILGQTEAPTVFCTSGELKHLFTAAPSITTLKFIVLCDVATVPEAEAATAAKFNIKLFTLKEIEAIGTKYPIAPTYLKGDDLCFLMYTSGTTGDPKGVKLTSQNILGCMLGIEDRLRKGKLLDVFTEKSVHLSYLPLPHILEQLIHSVMIHYGASIGFFQGNTLKLMDDLGELRPTLFVTVPRLLNKIYDKIVNGANAGGGFKAWLFKFALETKMANLKRGYTSHPLFDKLIFSKIQKKLGLDRCMAIVTGSAPVADDVLAFFRCLFTCPVLEGYGQSESTGAVNITDINDLSPGTVGPPMLSCEEKLVSVPEMGYEVTDTVHGDSDATRIPVNGRGEVCYRGPSIFPGYFKDDEKTLEAMDEEGWLHSGDIGVWTLDGRLKIVDRKKNIFKLSQGEYVAPEKIENIIKSSVYVAQPFVYGDSLHAVLVGIIVPEEVEIVNLAKTLGISGAFPELCKEPKIIDTVLKDIVAVGKKGLLNGFECVRAILLHPDPFTVENDLLTPTFKIKRNDVKKLFIKEIDALYVKTGDVVAGKNVQQNCLVCRDASFRNSNAASHVDRMDVWSCPHVSVLAPKTLHHPTISITRNDLNVPCILQKMLVILTYAVVFCGIAVILWYLQPTGRVNPPKTFCSPDLWTAKLGHGPIYRVGPFPKPAAKTTLEALQASVKRYPNKNFLGHRTRDCNDKAGDYIWASYEQVYKRIQNLAAGLVHEGLLIPSSSGHRILCIYMKNRPEWVISHYATLYCGGVVSCLYDSLGSSSTSFILKQTEASAVICTLAEYKNLCSVAGSIATLKHIILCDADELPTNAPPGVNLWLIEDLEAIGCEITMPATPNGANELCFLMYTSGTTGIPKGVQLTSYNLLSCMIGIEDRLKKGRLVKHFHSGAVHLSYLPLPHVLEQLIHCLVIKYGASIGFSQGSTSKLMDDMTTLRPTLFITVPRLLNKIYDTILAQANASGGIKKQIFHSVLALKLAAVQRGYTEYPLLDKILFKKIQKKLGLDRCIAILTGSAPASNDVLNFFRCLFTCPVLEGYGQSECTGAASITDLDDLSPGT
ncbi:long-chain-fatty-acid-CoA ligase, partial [Thraustotheca clavata]